MTTSLSFTPSVRTAPDWKRAFSSTAVAIVTLGVLGLAGCSKSDSAGSSSGGSASGLLGAAVLQQVPANNVAFGVVSTGGAGYQRYKKSPCGTASMSARFSDALSKSTDPNQAELKKIMEIAQKLGFMSSDPNAPDVASEMALYAAPNLTTKKMDAALFLIGATGQDLRKQLAVLKQAAIDDGKKVTAETVGSAEAFSISEEATSTTFTFAATADKLAVGTNKESAARLWGAADGAWVQSLRTQPRFQRATNNLPTEGEEFGFFYVDVNGVGEAVNALGMPGGFNKNDVPVESVALRASMGDAPTTGIAVAMEPRDDAQKRIFAALSGSGKSSLAEKFPAETVLFIGVDGRVSKTIKDEAIAAGAPIPPEEAENLALLDTTDGIGIGVRSARATSPFPEVSIAIQNSNATKLGSYLKDTVLELISAGSGGMPLQQKKIGDIDVSYILTPLGVGLYVGHGANAVYLTSSEPSFEEMVQLGGGKGVTLASTLSKQSQGLLGSGNPLFSTYINYEDGAELVKNLQGSLAMFTGGQALIEPSELEQFKKMGKVSIAGEWKDNVAVLRGSFDAPKK